LGVRARIKPQRKNCECVAQEEKGEDPTNTKEEIMSWGEYKAGRVQIRREDILTRICGRGEGKSHGKDVFLLVSGGGSGTWIYGWEQTSTKERKRKKIHNGRLEKKVDHGSVGEGSGSASVSVLGPQEVDENSKSRTQGSQRTKLQQGRGGRRTEL